MQGPGVHTTLDTTPMIHFEYNYFIIEWGIPLDTLYDIMSKLGFPFGNPLDPLVIVHSTPAILNPLIIIHQTAVTNQNEVYAILQL